MENNVCWEELVNASLEKTLDECFPNSRHHEIVEYEGKLYRKHFEPKIKHGTGLRPCGKLGAGKVKEWQYIWQVGRKPSELSSVQARLNHYFPKARSNEEVIFEGKRYRKKFSPVFSRSMKTIHRWESYWEELGDAESA